MYSFMIMFGAMITTSKMCVFYLILASAKVIPVPKLYMRAKSKPDHFSVFSRLARVKQSTFLHH